MPDKNTHINQAIHNAAFGRTIDDSNYSDWSMTVIFYEALQYIDALLARLADIHPAGHDVRDQEIHRRPELRPIATSYFRLKSRSLSARYCAARLPVNEIERSKADDLQRIRDHVLPQLS